MKRGYIKHKNKVKINKRDLRDISTNEKGCLNQYSSKSTAKTHVLINQGNVNMTKY